METIETYGNYSVIAYDENLVTIDFSNENVGLTIKPFCNKEVALKVFENTIKTLTSRKAKFYNDDIHKLVIYNS